MEPVSFQGLRERLARDVPAGGCDETGARRLWWAALETLQHHLINQAEPPQGVWLAAPLPALYAPGLISRLRGWVWAPDAIQRLTSMDMALPGSGAQPIHHFDRLDLRDGDGDDPFLLVITPSLQVALALHGPAGQRQLLMRCDAPTLSDALALIGGRLREQSPDRAAALHQALEQLGPLHSDSDWSARFWPEVAERLTGMAPSITLQAASESTPSSASEDDQELSLLEALTHEVRTPLATIRTLIRSLLRRRDLPPVAIQRLQQIDVECSEQIDRFGLIFHAAELQRQPSEATLARTDLGAILEALAPGWNDQLERRGVRLTLDLAPQLPMVLSDPRRLEPMLGGLIDRTSRGLTSGSRLDLVLRVAGARLKLQILVRRPDHDGSSDVRENSAGQAQVGPVLSWNPSTGSLQLSQRATRQLLASLGGRYRQRQDRSLTVFFPLATDSEQG